MTSRPSMKDVAAAAGVSLGTVSNVLNRPQQVGEAKQLRVLQAIKELGFVRNESARQLRSGTSRVVGLVVLDAGNPYFADVARGVENAVAESGGVVLLGNSAGDPERERRYLELFEEQRVRGVCITPSSDEQPRLDRLTRLGIPVVFLDRYPDEAPFSSVSVDDVSGGRTGAEHLLERGHTRLAFVGGPSLLRQVRERRAGAEEAVEAAGPGVSLLSVSTRGLNTQEGRRAAEELAAMSPAERPTGVLAANDLTALGLLQGFLRHGLRVPEDVALVGYDDIEFAESAAVPLSSIRQPREELGRRGGQLLLQAATARLEGRQPRLEQVRFTPDLIVRQSSDLTFGTVRHGPGRNRPPHL